MGHGCAALNRERLALLFAAWAGIFPAIAAAQTARGPDAQPQLHLAREIASIGKDGAPALRAAADPVQLAQASTLSTPAQIASAAAPRPGQGESALVNSVTEPRQPPREGEAPKPVAAPKLARTALPAAATEAPAAPAALGTGLRPWALAPIRWSGNVALNLQSTSTQDGGRQTQFLESTTLRGSSYLWQPWIAQLQGELSLSASQARAGGGAQGAAAAASAPQYSSINGSGLLALFPMSRFPLTVSVSQSDSRASGELTGSAYTSRRYAVTQSYRPMNGSSNYRLSYDHSEIRSDAVGTDTANALVAGMNWSGGPHALRFDANSYTNSRSSGGDSSSMNNVNATHSYRPGENFSVESFASVNTTQYRLSNVAAPANLDSRFLQLNTFATWRPGVNSPLRISGGARLFEVSTGAATATRTISANAAADYALNRNTRLNATGVFTQTPRGAYTSQGAGVAYSADPIKLGKFDYNRSAGANLSNRTGKENSARGLGANIGHRLGRNILLAEGSSLYIDASQDYSRSSDTLLSDSQTLSHSAGTSWSRNSGANASTVLSLRASDMRTTGYTDQHFQMLNLQANGRLAFSSWSSVSANLTFQAARQGATSGAYSAGLGTSANGNVRYQHNRMFGVPRLQYYAALNLNRSKAQRTRLDGDIDAPLEPVNWLLEQHLNYNIGRLQARLSLSFAEIGGKTNSMIFLRLLREFGDS